MNIFASLKKWRKKKIREEEGCPQKVVFPHSLGNDKCFWTSLPTVWSMDLCRSTWLTHRTFLALKCRRASLRYALLKGEDIICQNEIILGHISYFFFALQSPLVLFIPASSEYLSYIVLASLSDWSLLGFFLCLPGCVWCCLLIL